jgi:quinol monooxygenase YgiN
MPNPLHVLIFFEARPVKAKVLGCILVDLIARLRAESGCRYYELFATYRELGKFTVVEALDTP